MESKQRIILIIYYYKIAYNKTIMGSDYYIIFLSFESANTNLNQAMIDFVV